MTQSPLKLLLIEDSEDDVFFLTRILNKHGYVIDFTRIESGEELRAALSSESWDLIITDHTLPDFNSIEAVRILNELQYDIPLIVLSGTIDQSIAIESMRLGARDFIMKDDTARLIPAIERELREANYRREIVLSEEKSKRDLQGFMNHSPAFIFIKDTCGTYTFINKTGEKILQLQNPDILGKTDYDLFSHEDAKRLHSHDQSVLQTRRAIEADEYVKIDNETHIFSTIKYPLFDESGELYAICGISTDITDKKHQEEKLRRSQKMEAIGQLTGGIAHDFNNQLGIITGYLDFLADYLPADEKHKKWVDTAIRATLRCTDLTRQLLAFSRRSSDEKSVVDINAAFNEFSDMIKRSVTPQVAVTFSLAKELWHIEIDLGEFQDVILNLVINARDAMPQGGKLVIETKNEVIDEEAKLLNAEIVPGEYVQMLISDTGSGMNAETMDHLFEPFYTTKPTGKGTGLGLSMIYGFVRRHHGDINVYSEEGIGSTFRLSFPRAKSAIDNIIKMNNKVDLPRGNELILIVDDEIELLKLADLYLRNLGYHTCTASNAVLALEILKNDDSIQLLFTDVIMPGGMNGYQLAEAALELRPKLKVQVTSGFTTESIEAYNLGSASNPLLSKPYNKADLAIGIRKLLDG